MATKPKRYPDKEITYSVEHWNTLKSLRDKAIWVMSAFENSHFEVTIHGSVARGDVKINSDIDIFIPEVQNSFLIETALEKANITINRRLIVQATPTYAMKAHIELDEKTTISFPLMDMRRVEREFYQFGGEANLAQLRTGIRVPGIDKRLMLIEPNAKGHKESSIIGIEEQVAKILGISAETVMDRVRTLLRRDTVGRTGVFIKKELLPEETFELALKELSETNAAVRRRMKK